MVSELRVNRCFKKVRAANNQPVKIVGELNDVDIKCFERWARVYFMICNGLNRKCILGMDFMMRNKIKLCMEKAEETKNLLAEHSIDTGDAKPVSIHYRRYGWNEEEEIKNQLAKLFKDGIVSESMSQWRAPLVLVLKREGRRGFVTI